MFGCLAGPVDRQVVGTNSFECRSAVVFSRCHRNLTIDSYTYLIILDVVTLQTFYLGKLDLLTVYLGKLIIFSVTGFSPSNLPRGNFIIWSLNMSREQ